MRILHSFLVFVFATFGLLMMTTPVRAASFDYQLDTTYTVEKDFKTTVETVVTVLNRSSQRSPSSLRLPVSGSAISGMSARYTDDGRDVKTRFSAESNEIVLETTRNDTGKGKRWSVAVQYTTDAGRQLGTTYLLSVAPVRELPVVSQTVSIRSDLKLGVAASRGSEPDVTTIEEGYQVLRWQDQKGPLDGVVGILVGENSVANVRIEKTLRNATFWWQTQTVTLPPDTNQQKAFLESITPEPSKIHLDTDGNILAEYRLRPRQSINVVAESRIEVNNYTYSLDSKSSLQDIPQGLAGDYTTLNDIWQSNNGGEDTDSPVLEQIKAAYQANTETTFNGETEFQIREKRVNSLVGTLRGKGIPARVVYGKVFGDGGRLLSRAENHVWLEAYLPGTGWMTLDPWFETNGNYFGETDVQRVGLVLRGLRPDFPPEQLSKTSVVFTDQTVNQEEEPKPVVPQLNATKYMLLPGLAMQVISVEMPAGNIVDDTGLMVPGQGLQPLGSLSPMQRVSIRALSLGADAFSSGTAQYGTLAENATELADSSAETGTSISYLPLMLLVAALALAFTVKFGVKKLIKKRVKKTKSSKDAFILHQEDSGQHIEHDDLLARHSAQTQSAPHSSDNGSNRNTDTQKMPAPVVNTSKSPTQPEAAKQGDVQPPVNQSRPISSTSASAQTQASPVPPPRMSTPPMAESESQQSLTQKTERKPFAYKTGTMPNVRKAPVKQSTPGRRPPVIQ